MSTHTYEEAMAKSLDLAERKMKHVAVTIDGDIQSDPSYPVDAGIMRSSQGVETTRGASTITNTWYNSQFYAPFVHQGTGLYATDGKGRKTPWTYTARIGGKLVTVRTHGMKPRRFIEKHTTDKAKRIEELMKEV